MKTERIIMSGFGGQGIMGMGQLLTHAGMIAGKNVSWLPSYGPEMRGGAANCSVIISEDPVGAPTISRATNVIVMNEPSFVKFEDFVEPGGALFVNSSLINTKTSRDDIDVYEIPANEIAQELGNDRVANMVMLGAYLEKVNIVDRETVLDAFREVYGEKTEQILPVNIKALDAGKEVVQ